MSTKRLKMIEGLKLINRRFASSKNSSFVNAGSTSSQYNKTVKRSKACILKSLSVQVLISNSPTSYGFVGVVVFVTKVNGELQEVCSLGGSLLNTNYCFNMAIDPNILFEPGESITISFTNEQGTQGAQITSSYLVEEYDIQE